VPARLDLVGKLVSVVLIIADWSAMMAACNCKR
jgi:hypothetical protein